MQDWEKQVMDSMTTKQEEGFLRKERRVGRVERTIPLPLKAHEAKINAQYKDGVLSLTIPKAEEHEMNVIEIK